MLHSAVKSIRLKNAANAYSGTVVHDAAVLHDFGKDEGKLYDEKIIAEDLKRA